MSEDTKDRSSTVIPAITYRNAPTAIDWLCRTFGFRQHAVYPNQDGTIAHAELIYGSGMIMLGSSQPGEYEARDQEKTRQSNARSVNLICSDPDAIYAKAKANGAEIIVKIEDKPYGGRGFACRDLEGYLWYIGSYDPWQKPSEQQGAL
jgi:uncharacterized glyoxalase superfamily protein PhnB